MKIAFTYQNNREITGHAGKTSRFLIYTLDENQEVKDKELVELNKEDILHVRFHESADPYAAHPIFEVDFLITGGAGGGFVNRLASQSVRVLITPEKDPDQAVKLLLQNKLPVLRPHNHVHH
jgi:predicted Fe-Mo cluster-binding NifX family protein